MRGLVWRRVVAGRAGLLSDPVFVVLIAYRTITRRSWPRPDPFPLRQFPAQDHMGKVRLQCFPLSIV